MMNRRSPEHHIVRGPKAHVADGRAYALPKSHNQVARGSGDGPQMTMTRETPLRGAQKQFSKMPLFGFLCPSLEFSAGHAGLDIINQGICIA
jgi:hypothetical protein